MPSAKLTQVKAATSKKPSAYLRCSSASCGLEARGEAEVAWCGSLKECVDNKASFLEDAAASTGGDGDGPS